MIANYIIETLGGRTITLYDGIYADVDNGDLTKMARDAFSHGKGLRRTAELGEITKLIDNARYSRSDDDAKHNKFSAFRYYSVKTRYKGEEESLLLNIEKTSSLGNIISTLLQWMTANKKTPVHLLRDVSWCATLLGAC